MTRASRSIPEAPHNPSFSPTAAELERSSRSRAAVLERFPQLGSLLATMPVTGLVRDQDGAIVDIDLGQGRLYGTDGRTLADGQVQAYLERPLRFYAVNVTGANTGSPVSFRLCQSIYKICGDLGLSLGDMEVKPQYDGGYLVILGLGLGYHLPELIEKSRARHIIILEPYAEFLQHSLAALDWQELFETHEARGCSFTVAIIDTPEKATVEIQKVFQREGLPFIDGAYVFMHYPLWILFEARDRLAQMVETLFISRGFYEDELVMIRNSLANVASHRFHLVDPTPRPARAEPVFLIGSGPSIDQSIAHVKRLRERAIVISCGSGIKVCLAHDIVPDFHCELENGNWVYDALQLISSHHSLAGITLIATTTVDPRVPPLFDHSILFFRDTSAGTKIIARPKWEVFGAAPTVANTALRIGVCLGFSNFYLFGIDCGTKSSSKKHSTNTIYSESSQFKKYEEMMDLKYSYEGNFGGVVHSDWVFNFSRKLLDRAISYLRVKCTNCSDGARLHNAKPQLAASLKLDTPPLDHARIRERIFETLRDYAPGELMDRLSYETLQSEARRYRTDLLAMVDAARAEDTDFVAFWKRLSAFVDDTANEYARIPSLTNGSLVSMPKIGMFFTHRIREPELRRKVYEAFLEEYRSIVEFMCDGIDEHFAALSRDYPLPAAPESPSC